MDIISVTRQHISESVRVKEALLHDPKARILMIMTVSIQPTQLLSAEMLSSLKVRLCLIKPSPTKKYVFLS